MKLYCKVGTMPGQYLKPVGRWSGVALRKAPVIGQCFALKDPDQRYAKPQPVRLYAIRVLGNEAVLYCCERF
jgi:hypothetical protein